MNHPVHHAISAAAAPTAVVAFLTQWNPVLTGAVTILGIVWYGILFYDRFLKKRQDD